MLAGSRLWIQSGALNDVALYAARLSAAQVEMVQVQARVRADALQLDPLAVWIGIEALDEGARVTVRYRVKPTWLSRLFLRLGKPPWITVTQTAYRKPRTLSSR